MPKSNYSGVLMGSREVCITGLDWYWLSILDSYNHLGVWNLLSKLKHITPDGFQFRLFKFLFLRLDTLPRWSFIMRRTLWRWSRSCVSSATFCAFFTVPLSSVIDHLYLINPATWSSWSLLREGWTCIQATLLAITGAAALPWWPCGFSMSRKD